MREERDKGDTTLYIKGRVPFICPLYLSEYRKRGNAGLHSEIFRLFRRRFLLPQIIEQIHIVGVIQFKPLRNRRR